MGQFIFKGGGIWFAGKVATALSPPSDALGHAADHLPYGGFALRRSQGTTEVFGSDNVRGHLRPKLRKFDIVLFKDDLTAFTRDQGLPELPVHLIKRAHTGACEIARYGQTGWRGLTLKSGSVIRMKKGGLTVTRRTMKV